jgi:hypothetical protein
MVRHPILFIVLVRNYMVTVTDDNSCTKSASYEIVDPEENLYRG